MLVLVAVLEVSKSLILHQRRHPLCGRVCARLLPDHLPPPAPHPCPRSPLTLLLERPKISRCCSARCCHPSPYGGQCMLYYTLPVWVCNVLRAGEPSAKRASQSSAGRGQPLSPIDELGEVIQWHLPPAPPLVNPLVSPLVSPPSQDEGPLGVAGVVGGVPGGQRGGASQDEGRQATPPAEENYRRYHQLEAEPAPEHFWRNYRPFWRRQKTWWQA